jgi:hypothetical protein
VRDSIDPVVRSLGPGASDFEEERPFRESELIQQALGLDRVLAAKTVRLYAEKMTETPELVKGLEEQIHECNQRLLSQATFMAIKTKGHEYIPCDIDTSVMNNGGTKKEKSDGRIRGAKDTIRYSHILGRRATCCRASCGRETGIARRGHLSFCGG